MLAVDCAKGSRAHRERPKSTNVIPRRSRRISCGNAGGRLPPLRIYIQMCCTVGRADSARRIGSV